MIRKLNQKDQKIVLDFAYRRERENLFVIGAFNTYKKPFEANHFFGYFNRGKLVGLATSFGRWGSFVVNAQKKQVIRDLTDYAIKQGIKIRHVPCFQKYGEVIMDYLKKAHHLCPKQILSRQKIMLLKKENFKNFSTDAVTRAFKKDVDAIIRFDRIIENENLRKPIQAIDRKRINPRETFILKIKRKIVSRVNLHGYSKRYFQLGGVGTLPEHRGKGYAKQVVSALCKYHFEKGLRYALLFTANKNKPALKVYSALGFRPTAKFIIANYAE